MNQVLAQTQKKISFAKGKAFSRAESVAIFQRKAETRTKIQLGGLVIKSGLTEAFSISQGVDLQLDEAEKEKATLLLGALIDLRQSMASNSLTPSQKEEWAHLGKAAFVNHFLRVR